MPQIALELTALLFLWLGLRVWHHDRSARGRRPFMALCAAGFLWCTAVLCALHGALEPRQVVRLGYAGTLLTPPLWLCVALAVRGAEIVQRSPGRLVVLFVPAVLCYPLLWLDAPLGDWFVVDDGSYGTPGPLWFVNAGYSWGLGIAGSLHFLKARSRSRDPRARLRGRVVGVVSLAPTLGNLAWVLYGMPAPDPTPLLLLVAATAIRNELFAGDLLQMLPVSRHDLLRHIPTPLILVDLSDRITAINPAAEARLGIPGAEAVDRNVDALLEEAIDAPPFERWSLVSTGREAGHILVPARKTPGRDGSAW